MPPRPLSPLPDILADLRAGKMVILTDDENRENEGDRILLSSPICPSRAVRCSRMAQGIVSVNHADNRRFSADGADR